MRPGNRSSVIPPSSFCLSNRYSPCLCVNLKRRPCCVYRREIPRQKTQSNSIIISSDYQRPTKLSLSPRTTCLLLIGSVGALNIDRGVYVESSSSREEVTWSILKFEQSSFFECFGKNERERTQDTINRERKQTNSLV